MFQPLSEGLKALSRYVAELVHVNVDLEVVRSLRRNEQIDEDVSVRTGGASRISNLSTCGLMEM